MYHVAVGSAAFGSVVAAAARASAFTETVCGE